jgi:hypothetical protein
MQKVYVASARISRIRFMELYNMQNTICLWLGESLVILQLQGLTLICKLFPDSAEVLVEVYI